MCRRSDQRQQSSTPCTNPAENILREGRDSLAANQNATETRLIAPYGGTLVDLTVAEEAIRERREYASELPTIQLSERAVCDLELLATGAFSPLDRFMGSEVHQRVLEEMRLRGGKLFPIPVVLSVEKGPTIALDKQVSLRNARNEILALMMVEEIYEWELQEVARHVFGTTDLHHPVVKMHRWGPLNISGRLEVLQLPPRYDFRELRLTPAETRRSLEARGRTNVVAFQTQSVTPSTRGNNKTRGQSRRRRASVASRGGHDKARRRRSLHSRANL